MKRTVQQNVRPKGSITIVIFTGAAGVLKSLHSKIYVVWEASRLKATGARSPAKVNNKSEEAVKGEFIVRDKYHVILKSQFSVLF